MAVKVGENLFNTLKSSKFEPNLKFMLFTNFVLLSTLILFVCPPNTHTNIKVIWVPFEVLNHLKRWLSFGIMEQPQIIDV